MYGAPAPDRAVWYLGVDLGQAQDYTALALIEQAVWFPTHDARRAAGVEWSYTTGWELFATGSNEEDLEGWVQPSRLTPRRLEAALTWAKGHGRPPDPPLACTHLERLALGTPYPKVVERVQRLVSTHPLSPAHVAIVVDHTGVGRAVVDAFDAAGVSVVPVSITAGAAVSGNAAEGFHVAKRQLIAVTQVAMQNRRLRVAPALPEAATLTRELAIMKVKVTAAANETFASWRESDHDDLALALALSVWFRMWWCTRYDATYRRRALTDDGVAPTASYGTPDLSLSEIRQHQTQRSLST